MMEDELLEEVGVLRKAAEAAGSLVVDAVLKGHDCDGVLMAAPEPDDFLKVMAHCSPRVFYLHVETFDALRDTLVVMEADDDEEVAKDGRVKNLVRKWKARDGKVSLILAAFVADGVLHVSMRQPEWTDEFEAEAEEIANTLSEETHEAAARTEREARDRIRELATRLCEHPKFNGPPRPSREKRAALASHLFPECGEYEIRLVVEEATNLDFVHGER
jgi:plasmid stabilization system protein ParE